MAPPAEISEASRSSREHSFAEPGRTNFSKPVQLEDLGNPGSQRQEQGASMRSQVLTTQSFGIHNTSQFRTLWARGRKLCERRPRKIIDETGYLGALAGGRNERQRENIAACIKAVEDGKPFGESDILCGGEIIDFDNWVPAMGPRLAP